MDIMKKAVNDYEYIIVGTGPGGAPAARELARAGKKVLMVEKGNYHKKLWIPLAFRLSWNGLCTLFIRL